MQNTRAQTLASLIQNKQARIAVIGLGYVGLPLLNAFHQAGFAVSGLDTNAQKIANLQAGIHAIPDIDAQEFASLAADPRTLFSDQASLLKQADVILICVPTPLSPSKEPDLSYILSAAEAIQTQSRSGQLIILESTTYPGTTDEVLLPILERGGLALDQEIFVAFSPERIDPGNQQFPVSKIPKVVGGLSQSSGDLAQLLYAQIIEEVHRVSSARVAETAKILENTFRSVNIALVNEFAGICRTLGVDVWEVIEAAATKPFGFMKFLPGPGIGGHCIPLDPHYLIWKTRMMGYEPRFISLADQINSKMPEQVVLLAMDSLNQVSKPLKGSNLLLIGVAYKPNINDSRESPAQPLIQLLQSRGAVITYHDPWVPQFGKPPGKLQSQALTAAHLQAQDLVMIITAHQQIDYALIAQHSVLIVDTRNVMRSYQTSPGQVVYL